MLQLQLLRVRVLLVAVLVEQAAQLPSLTREDLMQRAL